MFHLASRDFAFFGLGSVAKGGEMVRSCIPRNENEDGSPFLGEGRGLRVRSDDDSVDRHTA